MLLKNISCATFLESMKNKNFRKIRLFLLGTFMLEVDRQVIKLPTRKSESLLAYIVLNSSPQNRVKLASLLWGDSSDDEASGSLRTALSAIRKILGKDVLISDRETVQINPNYPIWVDVHELELFSKELASSGVYIHALFDVELYRGNFLENFYDEWVIQPQEYFKDLFIRSMLQVAQSRKALGIYQEVVSITRRIIQIDAINENAYQLLMFSLHALGKRDEAIKLYNKLKYELLNTLGVETSNVTNNLFNQINKIDMVSETSIRVKTNLPTPLTSFIGREKEIKDLNKLFQKTRLLTLTGVGGCGKTRLSIELARNLMDNYVDGVWWVDLASLEDPNLIPRVLRKILGIEKSTSSADSDTLVQYLCNKQLLLIFDNCEHLIQACALLVENILKKCPNVKILTTSREILGVFGETAWIVSGLSLPPLDHILYSDSLFQWEAINLFLTRSAFYQPGIQLSDENIKNLLYICHVLDGIPLAIELAAVRTRNLTLEQIASRLSDRLTLLTMGSRTAQERQRTLRSAIDWSYELLSISEKIILQRLSVFTSTWTLSAAEFICSDEQINSAQILDIIARLYNKSFLIIETQGVEIRYKMLEVIRQYAYEKISNRDGVEWFQSKHLQYYMEIIQSIRHLWFTSKHSELINQFGADYPNLRLALSWGLEQGIRHSNWKRAINLAVGMGPLWNFLGEYDEGQKWLKKAIYQIDSILLETGLEVEESYSIRLLKAKALYELGFLTWFQGQYISAGAIFLECSVLFETLDDLHGLAYSNMFLAHPAFLEGERERALKMWRQSLDFFNDVGDFWGSAMVHSFLGRAYREAGNNVRAEKEYDMCLELFGKVGDGWGLGISLSHKGMIAFQRNDLEGARKFFEDRMIISREHKFNYSTYYSIFLLGIVFWKLNKPNQVQANMQEVVEYFLRNGNYAVTIDCLIGLAWVSAEKGHIAETAYLLGVIEKSNQIYYRGETTFETIWFHKPVLEDLYSRIEIIEYSDLIESGRNSNLGQVIKGLLKN